MPPTEHPRTGALRSCTRVILRWPLLWPVGLCSVAALVGYICRNYFADDIPIHWTIDNVPDAYIPRLPFLLGWTLVAFLVSFLIQVAVWTDSSIRTHGENSKTALNGLVVVPSLFLLALEWVVATSALREGHALRLRTLLFVLGLLLVAIGYIMVFLEPNRVAGIRSPWTRNSRSVWDKTQIFASGAYGFSGCLCCVFSLLWFPEWVQVACIIFFAITPPVAAFGYSYIIRERPRYTASDWDNFTGAQPLNESEEGGV